MVETNLDDLKQLLLASAGAILQVSVNDVDVVSGIDSTGRPAYFVEYQIGTSADRAKASLLRTRLTQELRDKLISRGDARYPFVRLVEQRDWTKRHAAAS